MSPQEMIQLVIKISLWTMAGAIGMQSTLGELLRLFRHPHRLARATLAVNVVVPLAAVAVVAIFPLIPIVKVGIVLMAVSPAAPLIPGNAEKAGVTRVASFALYTALVLLGVVIVPVTVALLSAYYGIKVALPPLLVAERFAEEVLLPLAAGLVFHRLAPQLSERLGEVADKVATLLLFAAAVPIIVMGWPQMWALVGNGTVVAIILLCLIAIAGGHILGGPVTHDRAALAVASVSRHPGIAIAIAGAAQADKRVTAAILSVLLIGVVMGALYRAWLQRQPVVAAA